MMFRLPGLPRLPYLAALLCLCFLSQAAFAGSFSWVTQERWVSVKKVLDGDTFATRKGEKIRLLGINTPEIRHDSSAAQPFGNAAKKFLTALIAGKQVRLTFDKEKTDRYGRTLAHVYTREGLWVNAELVRQGLAHVYTFEPNIKAANDLIEIEKQAISADKGMWTDERWRVVSEEGLIPKMLGQFRVFNGVLIQINTKLWQLQMGELKVSVSKKARKNFSKGLNYKIGDNLFVRGKLRISNKGNWFVSVYTPSDIAKW